MMQVRLSKPSSFTLEAWHSMWFVQRSGHITLALSAYEPSDSIAGLERDAAQPLSMFGGCYAATEFTVDD